MNYFSEFIYKRTSTGKIQQWQYEVDGVNGSYRAHYGQKGGKIQTTPWTLCTPKNVGKVNETTAAEQAHLEAKAVMQDKLDKDYVVTLEGVDDTGFIKPMLAHSYEEGKTVLKFPLIIQPKLDGFRCIATKDGLFSRQNRKFDNVPHIEAALKHIFEKYPHVILDGELYFHGLTFEDIQSIISKEDKTAEELEYARTHVQYHVYDHVNLTATTQERRDFLQTVYSNLVQESPAAIHLVSGVVVNNFEELTENALRYVEEGYEGSMLRTFDGLYKQGRSKDLLKYKTFQDEEFEIVLIKEGVGKAAGKVGSIVLKLPDGRTFSSNIEGTEEFKTQIYNNRDLYIGKTATCKFQHYTKKGIPRFPYVIKVAREDVEGARALFVERINATPAFELAIPGQKSRTELYIEQRTAELEEKMREKYPHIK